MAFGVYTWQNGIVASSTGAHESVSGDQVQTNRQAVFVSSTHANASNSHPGTSPEEPWATLAYAISQVGGADYVIVVASGHTETLTATVSQSSVWIIGEGTGTNRPTFTAHGTTDDPILTITGDGCVVRNLIFKDAAQNESDRTDPLVELNADYCVISDCHFRVMAGGIAFGADIGLRVGNSASSTHCEINTCVFDNEQDASGASNNDPSYAIYVVGTNSSGLRVIDCTFDGGTYGWEQAALALDPSAALTNFRVSGCTFENYADLAVANNSSRGLIWGNTFNTGSQFSADVTSSVLRHWPNGLLASGEDGHEMLTAADLFTFGRVFWVNSASATGSDASGYGNKRGRPFLTLAYALTQTGSGECDIIVLDEGHTEALASAQTVSNTMVKIYGVGAGTSRPTLTLSTTGDLLTASGAGFEIHGVRFTASSAAPSSARLVVSANGATIEGCGFVCGALDTTSVNITGNGVRFENNDFTISAQGPDAGVYINNTAVSYCTAYNNTATGNAAYTWTSGWLSVGSSHGGGLLVWANTCVTQVYTLITQTTSTNVHLAANVIDDTCKVEWA